MLVNKVLNLCLPMSEGDENCCVRKKPRLLNRSMCKRMHTLKVSGHSISTV